MKVFAQPLATVPTRNFETDAGLDLYSRDDDFLLCPGESHTFDTGIHIRLPKGKYGLVLSRSGLNMKHGIVAAGDGVIDQNYTGSIGVKLYNLGEESYKFKRGDRIAQLVIMDYYAPEIEVVDSLEDLGETDRSTQGFGSSGR